MINLAGREDCDEYIRKELDEAGIPVVRIEKGHTEVPYTITGKLLEFEFSRAWYYWVVSGEVPLDVAKEMYANPVGKDYVRVAGHCGCLPPEEWAFPHYEDLVRLGVYEDFKNMPLEKMVSAKCPTYGELAEMCNSGKIDAPRFVDIYHIDSQEGLNLFVETIKKYELA